MHRIDMAMATSLTRSRRAEGLHQSHHPHTNPRSPQQLAASARAAQNSQNYVANLQRTKRSLDDSARDFDPIVAKKARFTAGIAVEIPARSSLHFRTAREAGDAKKAAPTPQLTTRSQQPTTKSAAVAAPNGTTPAHAPPPAPTTTVAKPATTRGAHNNNDNTQHRQQQQEKQPAPAREKVGKYELNKLQPNLVDTKSQGRKLRSQEAIRFKSELSAYFSEYDEVIGNEPKKEHLLLPETPIVVDTSTKSASSDAAADALQQQIGSIRSFGDALFTDLWDSQRIDFSFLISKNNKLLEDPLPDSLFEPSHKKSERLERSIRNTERGRAQHERDQIVRLLDGLQGPDWLRVLGVSGITESRKKTFEPAREHFIKGCQAILEKFRTWATEEKRRKLEKDRANAEAKRRASQEHSEGEEEEEASADDDEKEEEVDGNGDTPTREIPDGDMDVEDDSQIPGAKDAEPPDESDVDASVAKQLREEALAAAKKKSRRGRRTVTPAPAPSPAPAPPRKVTAPKEFTSFFQNKPHLRDIALNKKPRRGRTQWAWGQAVPEFEEAEFQLPEEYLSETTLKSRARGKRRSRRHVTA